jgi:hypothetical protein
MKQRGNGIFEVEDSYLERTFGMDRIAAQCNLAAQW